MGRSRRDLQSQSSGRKRKIIKTNFKMNNAIILVELHDHANLSNSTFNSINLTSLSQTACKPSIMKFEPFAMLIAHTSRKSSLK